MNIFVIIFSLPLIFSQGPSQQGGLQGLKDGSKRESVYRECCELPSEKAPSQESESIRQTWIETVGRGVEEEPLQGRTLDSFSLGRFVGFIEGKIGCKSPHWWASSFQKLKSYPHHTFGATGEDDFKRLGLGPVSINPATISGRIVESNLVLKKDAREIRIPLSLLQGALGRTSPYVSVLFGDDFAFVAGYERSPLPYEVLCIEYGTNAVRWTIKIHEGEDDLAQQGYVYHNVEMSQCNGQLLVFGLFRGGRYLDVIDIENGSIKTHFNSRD